MPMSPTEAAQKIGLSRRTLMRAIERQEIKAYRDNRNRWKIDSEDLEKWAGAQWAPTGHAQAAAPIVPTYAPTMTDVENERLRGEVRTERALREAAEHDRDAWRAQAERLTMALPPPPPSPEPPRRRRWWPWR